ncbi:glycoside hydrolase family 5 protein [Nonomuraea pusilla]|uniref:Aryl-phospho-beta-D-glucosidase BglC, GH1 family n=1 Tax=Nonomuraea pusilla TaxID=46177 RepID=A0A1H7Y6S2_9ACTN|nr:cellulase family glycosylhydrolase [Nonomuraea pusilla]SEM41820.1 Aryl-phospho-beta-D-glucosidase BglC, GH1 family [Nonomuraea pusilla]
MSPHRIAWSSTAVLALIVAAGAVADPSGLLALLGWSGTRWWPVEAAWQVAPLLVYTPLLLAGTWWVVCSFAAVPGLPARWSFCLVWGGVALAALAAKFAMSLVVVPSPDPAWLAWGTGFTVGKAAIAGLAVALCAVLMRRRTHAAAVPSAPPRPAWAGSWTGALVLGLVTVVTGPWLAGRWWVGSSSAFLYGEGMPAPTPRAGVMALIAGVAVLVVATAACQRLTATWVTPGGSASAVFLSGWLAVIGAGVVLAIVQTLAGLLSGEAADALGNDLWPLAAWYLRTCDGVSYGVAAGWVVGLTGLLAQRRAHAAAPGAGTFALAAAAITVSAVAVVPGQRPLHDVPPAVAAGAGRLLPLGVSQDERRVIVDSGGRQVILRGVNVSQLVDFYRGRPGHPPTRPLTEQDFAHIARLGFNVVRLGISWSRLEPQPGRYDAGYVAAIRRAVDDAAAHGVYTVIDMHQDAWSAEPTPPGTRCHAGTEPMAGFDGAPAWATRADGGPRCQFTGRDISAFGNRAFTSFYHDRDGVQGHLVRAWAHLAGQFAGDTSVAGFDLLNEPGFGETAPITSSLLLGRYYDRAIQAIRAAERAAGGRPHLVFFEPSILWSGTGFDALPPAGFTQDRALVFAPHLYAESITMDASLGLPPIVSVERGFALAQRAADAYGVPLWSGEWGFFSEPREPDVRRFTGLADRYRVGDAYWVWRQACGDPHSGDEMVVRSLVGHDCRTGADLPEVSSGVIRELNRAYPRAAPGRITSLSGRGSRLSLSGRAGGGDCRLDVWVPGGPRPEAVATGIRDVGVTGVDGGWRVTGCASGDYTLRIAPAP